MLIRMDEITVLSKTSMQCKCLVTKIIVIEQLAKSMPTGKRHADALFLAASNVYVDNMKCKQWINFHFAALLCISAAYGVVRCLSVTFVYCVETGEDDIVAMKCETIPKLSNGIGTIFQWPFSNLDVTQISTSCRSTLNISVTVYKIDACLDHK